MKWLSLFVCFVAVAALSGVLCAENESADTALANELADVDGYNMTAAPDVTAPTYVTPTEPPGAAVPVSSEPLDGTPMVTSPFGTAPSAVPPSSGDGPLAEAPNYLPPNTASPVTVSPVGGTSPLPEIVDGEDQEQPTLFWVGSDTSLSNDESVEVSVNGSSDALALSYFIDIYLKWAIPNNVNSMNSLTLFLERTPMRAPIPITYDCAVYIEPVGDWDETTVSRSNRQGLTFHKTEQDRLTTCTVDDEGLAISLDNSISMMSQALTSRTLTLRVSIIDSGKRAVSQSETVSFYSRESGIGAPTLAMAFCGDLIVQNGEECDQGPLGGTTCTASCTWYRDANNQTATEILANVDPRVMAPIVIVIAAVAAGAITFLILFYNRKQRQEQAKYKPFRGPNALVQNGDVHPERLAQLEKILVNDTNNYALAVAICRAANAAEMDHTAKALSFVFQSSRCCLELLEKLVSYEVQKTSQETTLFRQDSMASKIMGSYANIIGASYLKSILEPVLDPIVRHNIRCEVETLKLDEEDNVDANRVNLQALCEQVFTAIVDQPQRMPEQIQKLCQMLRNNVESKFPNSANKSIGAFLFLRFISPAVLLSTTNGIVHARNLTATPRALMLVARVLTKLANEVQFLPHEKDFLFMNEFLTRNLPKLHRFYDTITVVMNRPVDVDIPSAAKDQGLITLYTHIERNFEKIKGALQDATVAEELKRVLSKDEVHVFLDEESSYSAGTEPSANSMRERLIQV
jgi:hypothetical protein